MDRPANVNTLWGRVLADELARCGLRHAVIAPGSRSTPLVLALARHPDVQDHSVIDERSAAFFALGVARATGEPAAVVTTSGTAAGNLLPAVLEADRAGVPLLLLTAARPPELRDAGASQSADQVKLFGERVRWFHAVAEPTADDGRLRYLRSTACEAWARALGTGGPPGPVHLDLLFRKPLEPTPVSQGEEGSLPAGFDLEGPGAAGRPGGAPWRRLTPGRPAPDPAAVEELALALAGARRPLLLVGALNPTDAAPPAGPRPEGPPGLREALAVLLEALPLPVWAEAASQVRLAPLQRSGSAGGDLRGALIGTAGLLLESGRFREGARPDLVVRLGEGPLDWPLRRFAADLADLGAAQWAVDPWGRRRDPEHGVARAVAADPALLLEAVAGWLARHRPPVAIDPGWLPLHRAADRTAREVLDPAVAAREELFDGGVLWRLGRHLPEGAALVLSSSMALREAEAFLPASSEAVDVFANRGLNGIDGVTSTALGVAEARRVAGESRTALVTGDVAFAHDLSGALAAGRSGSDLVVVLLDNGGGAIFDHLPAAGLLGPAFERHLTTPPGADFGAVVRGLGWTHAAPESWQALDEELAAAFETPRQAPHLIQVRTDRGRTKELREGVLAEAADAVNEALNSPPSPDRARSPTPDSSLRTPDSRASPGEPAPVLLLHGFTGSGAGMARLARPLADAGFRVVVPDLPGHGPWEGRAPVPAGGATMEAAVAASVGALDRRGLGPPGRAHWVGYSMGGRVALAAALAHPERVASLTLIGASPGMENEDERRERRQADEALAREIEEEGLAAFVDRWMARPLFAGQARLGHRHLREARAERLRGSARGYAASLRGMGQGAQPSFWGRLGELAAPVLLIVGAEDEKYRAIVRGMAERIPDARVIEIPGAGHAAHLEAEDDVARAILDHVARASSEGTRA